jgi:hypothetical protein
MDDCNHLLVVVSTEVEGLLIGAIRPVAVREHKPEMFSLDFATFHASLFRQKNPCKPWGPW